MARSKDRPKIACPHCGKVTFIGSMKNHVRFAHEEDPAERFWAAVDKNGPNGCWIYTKGKDKWGYGDLRWNNKHIQAHRLAWKLLKGEPGELDCLHKCNNPSCCNPDHLYLGTDLDNARDRVAIGNVARGEQTKRNKLTAAQVIDIRATFRKDGPSKGDRSNARELAQRYGVDIGTVQAVVYGRTWRHL